MGSMGRRELREHVFRLLFQVNFYPGDEMKAQEELYLEYLMEPDAAEVEYIQTKTAKILEVIPELDEMINAQAVNWQTDRMGRVDLTILRLALYEMKYDEDVPTGVAINEAVELAKRYGEDRSPSFINGVLAKLI